MSDHDQLARMIDGAYRMVVFTGAGISTESGVPDFRSPGGVWSRMKPIYFNDFVAHEDKRLEAWTRVFNRSAGWSIGRRYSMRSPTISESIAFASSRSQAARPTRTRLAG